MCVTSNTVHHRHSANMKEIFFLFVLVITTLGNVFAESEVPQLITLSLDLVPLNIPYTNNIPQSLENVERRGKNLGYEYLNNLDQNFYTCQLYIGTPPRAFTFLIDTTFALMWVTSSEQCNTDKKYCDNHVTYDSKKSKTFKNIGQKYRGRHLFGNIEGKIIKDDVIIQNLKIKGQLFGESSYVDNELLTARFDGVLSLAFYTDTEGDLKNVQPPIVSLFQQKRIKQSVFGLYLSKDESKSKSELIIGGLTSRHYTEPLIFTAVVNEYDWFIKIDKISTCENEIGSYHVRPNHQVANIMGPSDVIETINKMIGAKFDESLGVYVVDCNKKGSLKTVNFVIQNHTFPLEAEDYVKEVTLKDHSVICIPGFVAQPYTNYITLGAIFMQKYFTLYDFGTLRVGFAPAKP